MSVLERAKIAVAQRLPPSLRNPIRRILRTFISSEEAFGKIYYRNDWGSPESVSGLGSELAATYAVRTELPILLEELGVRSLLDAPCGDFNWMKDVDLRLDRYIGADVVPELIEKAKQFSSDTRTFMVLDITSTNVSRADAILCRDCLVHLPFSRIRAALQNFKRSNATYLITTTFPGYPSKNNDIAVGDWRPLDLQKPPFNFPEPLKVISENDVFVAEKSLAVWRLDRIDV